MTKFTIDRRDLLAIAQFASKEDDNNSPIMTGVNISFDPKKCTVRVVATNTHALGLLNRVYDRIYDGKQPLLKLINYSDVDSFTIPLKPFMMFLRMKSKENIVTVQHDAGEISIEFPTTPCGTRIVTRTLEALTAGKSYPNFGKAFPKNFNLSTFRLSINSIYLSCVAKALTILNPKGVSKLLFWLGDKVKTDGIEAGSYNGPIMITCPSEKDFVSLVTPIFAYYDDYKFPEWLNELMIEQ